MKVISTVVNKHERLQPLPEPINNTPMSQDEIAKVCNDLADFIHSCDTLQDAALACSRIYNTEYFEHEGSKEFLYALSNLLLAELVSAEPLIEESFNLWSLYAQNV